MKKNKGRELVRIFELYSRMSGAGRKKFIRYAAKMGETTGTATMNDKYQRFRRDGNYLNYSRRCK